MESKGAPAITIVMPVYNTAPYLPQSLESILGQTFGDFELLCVDDSSTDASVEILGEYAKHDQRVTLVRQETHRNAGAARNMGMGLAKGKWLIFLDSDDYFAPDLLEKAHGLGESCQADVVYFHCFHKDERTGQVKEKPRSLYFRNLGGRVFSGKDIPDMVFDALPEVSWTKLCRRSFLEQRGISFQEILSSNDVYFGCCVAVLAGRIVYTPEPLVYYRVNHSRQITATRGKNPLHAYEAMRRVKERMEAEGLLGIYRRSFCRYALNNLTYAMEAPGNSAVGNLQMRKFLKREGWKKLGMDACTEEDFLFGHDYERYARLRFLPEEIYPGRLFEALKRLSFRCLLWGFGELGRRFYEAAKLYEYPLYGIIDNDPGKKGLKVDEFTIRGLCDTELDCDAVIITNERYGMDIRAQLDQHNGMGVRMIDVGTYSTYGAKLKECIY